MSLKISQNTEVMILEKQTHKLGFNKIKNFQPLKDTVKEYEKATVNPNQNEIPLYTLWVGQNLKRQIKTSVDKNVEKSEAADGNVKSCTADGTVKCCSHSGKHSGSFLNFSPTPSSLCSNLTWDRGCVLI